MKKRSHCDRVTKALHEFDQGRTRKLSRRERKSLTVAGDRLEMLLRADPACGVELSPYMKSLLGGKHVTDEEQFRTAVAAQV